MDYKVTSEIYDELNYERSSEAASISCKYMVSKFKFKRLPNKSEIDEDGDLKVPRKHDGIYEIIEIEHSNRTSLELVGMQMWRGSLLLADWIINNQDLFPKNKFILELGGGVGFTSIVAAMFYPTICTDVNRENLLKLMESNVKRNENLIKFPIKTVELDFFSSIPNYIEQNIDNISIIIVAEVIYNDELTDAFIKTVEQLLLISPTKKTVYLAAEKRFVFTIADCDSVAPCFEHFLKQISLSKLCYEEISLNFPQYFEYDRVKELILCKLELRN